jgi:diguanylate cyclase (GGDEF)-like protein
MNVKRADSHGQRRVLVADDSRVARSLLRAQLAARGYEVTEAADGDQALQLARSEAPDVVLLDIELPGEDGFEVLARMKADPELRHVPVVFLTRRTGTDDVVRGLECGAQDYLRKPVEASELVARIHAAVRAKTLQDRLRSANAELERSASTDPLTGLYNRRIVDEELKRLVSRATRHGHPFVLVMLDVDHFKLINDSHGHQTGDAALVIVAQRLRQALDREDMLGRWGGEEFVVLAPEARVLQGSGLSERLCHAVARRAVAPHGIQIALTVSAGYAMWRPGDDGDALLRRADSGLYAAKSAGRGCARSGDEPAARG